MNTKPRLLTFGSITGNTGFFMTAAMRQLCWVDACFYQDPPETWGEYLTRQYDFLYVRDPFNITPQLKLDEVERRLNLIFTQNRADYVVDKVVNFEDVQLEDKWLQYQWLKKFMPATHLLSDFRPLDLRDWFVKKRVASGNKGAVNDLATVTNPLDYIVKRRIALVREYRVFVVCGDLVESMTVRSSYRGPGTAVKVLGHVPIDDTVQEFVQKIDVILPWDFTGYDVGVDTDGKPWLIEANRSPAMRAHYTHTGENLAERLVRGLLRNRER